MKLQVIFLLILWMSMVSGQTLMSLKPCSGRLEHCFMPPCEVATCPAFPQAECRNNYCGSCDAEFWDGDTEVTSQCNDASIQGRIASTSDCAGPPKQCFMNPCQRTTCPGVPNAQCRTDECTCEAVFYQGGNDVTSSCRIASAPARTVDSECAGPPVRCVMNSCTSASCPGFPNAECRMSDCDCSAEFYLNGMKVKCETEVIFNRRGPTASSKHCKSGNMVKCGMSPCDVASCTIHPNAECRVNYCDMCTAEFWFGQTEVTDECKTGKARTISLDSGGPKPKTAPTKLVSSNCASSCLIHPCFFRRCSVFPNAECRNDFCGGCVARFYQGNREVTRQCSLRLPSFGSRGRLSRLFSGFSSQPKPTAPSWATGLGQRVRSSPWFSLFDSLF